MRWYECVIFYSGKVEVAKPSKIQKFLAAVYCCHLLVTLCNITLYPLSYVTCIINQKLYPIMYNLQVLCFVSVHISVSRKYDRILWRTNAFLRRRNSSVEIVTRLRFAQTRRRGSNSCKSSRPSLRHTHLHMQWALRHFIRGQAVEA